MKLLTKAMNAPTGLRVTFGSDNIEKFHVETIRPDPVDRYRIDVRIIMPESKAELWLDGVVSALRRIQNGRAWSVNLDYANAAQYFSLTQLERIDRQNEGFSMRLYGIPKREMDIMNKPKISVVSTAQFSKMYGKTGKWKNRKQKEDGKP